MNVLDIMLERETANDETATVVTIFVKSGSMVEKDEILFDIENSKATQEVVAPETGMLTHSLEVGHIVEFGVPIAQITPQIARMTERNIAVDRPPAKVINVTGPLPTESRKPQPAPAPDPAAPVAAPRFSHAAATLIAELGLTTVGFTGFVTARDVHAKLNGVSPDRPLVASQPARPASTCGTGQGEAVGVRKRAEIEILTQGAGATMLSVLGTSLGEMNVSRDTGHLLAGRITDLVIYEASRLLRKYPRLNAAYLNDRVHLHEVVHAGLAIDSGGQLVVYGIENADRIGLPDLADIIADAVARYTDNALTAAELTRATFTVTDLSADELDFVLPLLPRGQSCILGIVREVVSGYRIFAGFDHRVTEGREVASFLSELRQRLQTFASASIKPVSVTSSHCSFCGRSAAEAATRSKDRGLLKMVDRDGCDILCCASCWNGW